MRSRRSRILIISFFSCAFFALQGQGVGFLEYNKYHACQDEPTLVQVNDHYFNSNLLLDALIVEVFPTDSTKVPIYKHPSCSEENFKYSHFPYTVDSTARVRVNQPNLERVSRILENIMITKDLSYYEPLLLIYNEHQENFKNEWASSFFKYRLRCKPLMDQIRIMHCLEHTLKFFDMIKDEVERDELLEMVDRDVAKYYKSKVDPLTKWEIINQDEYYSTYYKSLKRKMIPLNMKFGYFMGFLDILEEHIVEKIKIAEGHLFDISIYENFELGLRGSELLFYLEIMQSRGSRKFERALEEKFDEFAKTGYVIRIFEYAQKNEEVSPEFIRFLVDKIYTHERFKEDLKVQESFTGIIGYLINEHTRPTIKQYLLNKVEADDTETRLRTWSYLVYFTNEPDVLQLMIEKSKQMNLSPEESKILKHNFERMLKAPDLSEESKAKVSHSLNKLPREKQKK